MSIIRSSPSGFSTSTVAFVRRALTDHVSVGALAPTSGALARRMAALVPTSPGQRVLELGAGTGAVSAAIGPRLGPGSWHLALERDPELLAAVAHSAPWARRIAGDAADLGAHLAEIGVSEVDVVISTLPWSYFDPDLQRRILSQVCSAMAPDGLFATIAARPAGLIPRSKVFRARLEASFEEVETTSTTWANIPPARLLVCRRPRIR
ncbi:class I SAM-dependent methyltransferase [Pseudonocardia spinosispora]|uniref:class I SAM-dependent methyltransferase n=1 Tax=Pseudonocardia spinosispora TaxID=103441 RepID=UPI00048C8E7E|nr:methyltransferase domain-containing protein [Pseudonocardia spinosispora]